MEEQGFDGFLDESVARKVANKRGRITNHAIPTTINDSQDLLSSMDELPSFSGDAPCPNCKEIIFFDWCFNYMEMQCPKCHFKYNRQAAIEACSKYNPDDNYKPELLGLQPNKLKSNKKLIFTILAGAFIILALFGNILGSQTLKRIAEADKMYEAGQFKEACDVYKGVIDDRLSFVPKDRKTDIIQKIINFTVNSKDFEGELKYKRLARDNGID